MGMSTPDRAARPSAPANSLGGSDPFASTTQQGRRTRKARPETKVSANETPTTEGCKRCRENPRSVCVACTQRRRRAMQLREQDGLTDEQIAARMRLSLPRVQRLLEEETQYRDLQQYVCNSVPAALLQDLIRRRQREDPALSIEEIATRAGYKSRLALQRAVGLEPTARKVRASKVYPPKLETTVDVAIASRIVCALGFAPHEIPGL
jgi:AraC-like DNA-binding protein